MEEPKLNEENIDYLELIDGVTHRAKFCASAVILASDEIAGDTFEGDPELVCPVLQEAFVKLREIQETVRTYHEKYGKKPEPEA